MARTLKTTVMQLTGALLLGSTALAQAAAPLIEVYKTPSCGCCVKWIDHLRLNGFAVKAIDVPETASIRKKFGIAEQHGSCHTAKVKGYAIEGHVPAADIKRLIKEKPSATGLAVPGMPMGSPGMEAEHADAYDVVLIKKNGSTSTYRHYKGS